MNSGLSSQMWKTLATFFVNYVVLSGAVITDWSEWPQNGYVGLSTDQISRTDSVSPCQPDDGVLLDYQDTPDLNGLLTDIVPMSKPAWISGDDNTGNCYYITVVLGSVHVSKSACDDRKYYLCYRPFDSAAESTTSMLTTAQTTEQLTTEATTTTTTTTAIAKSIMTTIESQTTTDINSSNNTETTVFYRTNTDEQQTTITGSNTSLQSEKATLNGTFYGLSWNVWVPWTECTASCNSGTRYRLKLCAKDELYENNCTRTLGVINNVTIMYATQWDDACNSEPCPVWSEWSPWNDCSATCGKGTTRRYRKCSVQDHFKCTGDGHETNFCDLDPCPAYVAENPPEEKSFKESDRRPLAIGLGSLSMIFVFVELVMIIILDSVTITTQCRFLKRNLRHLSPWKE